jgi:hypothetical protein
MVYSHLTDSAAFELQLKQLALAYEKIKYGNDGETLGIEALS